MKFISIMIFTIFSAVSFSADFSAQRSEAILAFLNDGNVQAAHQKTLNPSELGSVNAILEDFSSCNISINGCMTKFKVAQALQNGDRIGAYLITATVSILIDGNSDKVISVSNFKTLGR